MRPALDGLLDGSPSRGRLLMPTRAWTLTLISLVMRRRKSPFPPTVLESQTPRQRPAPLLRLLLPLLTSELLCIILLFFFFFFFTLGFEPLIYVMSFSINTPFSISSLFIFIFLFLFFCNRFPDAARSSSDLDRWLYGLCLSSWVLCKLGC